MEGGAWRTGAAGLLTLGLLAALAAGGGASSPEGMLLGVPSWTAGLASLVGLGGLVLLSRGRGWAPLLGLAPIGAVVLLAGWVGPLRAWTGPPLLVWVVAGVLVVLLGSDPPETRRLFLPVLLVVYVGVASRVQAEVGPQGDEPHYLMVSDALLRDHALSPERGYSEGRYRAFHPAPLSPDFRQRGRGGVIYSLHAVGLSVLLLPAYAAAGYPGASFFMAGVLVLLALEIRRLLDAWLGVTRLSEGLSWAVALSPPLIHYAGLLFTEVPAALLVAHALRNGGDGERPGPRSVLGACLAVSVLPWLNVRYAVVALLLLVFLLAGRPSRAAAAALVGAAAASALGLVLYHFVLYGFFDPRRVYGAHPELSIRRIPEGLQGLFLDQEFGLLVYAPLFALALPGLVHLVGDARRLGVASVGLVAAVSLTAAAWPMWRGGFNPPARFLVPVVPALALAVGSRLKRGAGSGPALLLAWGLVTGLAGAAEPALVHRDRDGTAPLFRADSGAEEWTRLLPRYVLGEPDRHGLALVWGSMLLLAALAPGRRATGPGLAGAVLALAAGTALASSLAVSRTLGRDAVRLLGRTALSLPDARLLAPAPARWGPEALDWGPLYEPHRHPEGAVLGGRLPLRRGHYRLEVEGERFGSGPQASLEVRSREGRPGTFVPLVPTRTGWEAYFDVAADGAETLLWRGGPPWRLRSIRLDLQPSGPGPV